MDFDRYEELRSILQQWRLRLAESIRGRIEGSARRVAQLQAIYGQEGLDEAFTTWLDRCCRQAGIQFILRVLFLRVLEDRGLLGVIRLRSTDGQRMWAELTRNLGVAHYVQWCFWDAAHLLPDLFGANDYDLVLPDDDLVRRFLDDVWRRPDPNREGWLRFDFRPDLTRGDEGFQTRFIGDLYQELDAEIRDRYAMVQTPHFISQFILEETLLKRFEEKDFQEVTLIDPTCGSGHFLVDAFWHFVGRYERARQDRSEDLSSLQRVEIARVIIDQHLFGCDINSYATALARFRLLLAACDYAHPTSLQDFRNLRFNLVTIDSLIPYEKLAVGSIRDDSSVAQVLGHPRDIEKALPVLRRRYDVVVGNPPYIQARDRIKRDLYREKYVAAYRKFHLSAPFTERFFSLGGRDACVGLIVSNAFTTRLFGKKLIEDVLPRYDVEAVIDLSGVRVPGHGTPTLTLFARNRGPSTDTVMVLSNLKGEPGIPSDPARGRVWQSVIRGFAAGPGYADEYVDVSARGRELLLRHPLQFGGPKSRLYWRLLAGAAGQLGSFADSIGFDAITGQDEIFKVSSDFARRLRAESLVKGLVIGEILRDWRLTCPLHVMFPYVDESQQTVELARFPEFSAYLTRYRDVLAERAYFGKTQVERGLRWYEYAIVLWEKRDTPVRIAYAFVATHNHFCLVDTHIVCKQSAPIIELGSERLDDPLFMTALLNTSVIALCVKQTCYNKGSGTDPVRDRYELSGESIGKMPIPRCYRSATPARHRLVSLAEEMVTCAGWLPSLSMGKLFELVGEAYYTRDCQIKGRVDPNYGLPSPFAGARGLGIARDKLVRLRREVRGRMIFLQEEMDWIGYDIYGLLKGGPPLAEDYLSPADYQSGGLCLGQRPFEVAGRGYKGDWPKGYQPPPLPEYLHPMTEARIAVIAANRDIDILEGPLYKRRWVPPNYETEFQQAAEWWLAELLEWALEQHGRPISLRDWARILGKDERVIATIEVLTGTPAFDLERELLKVIRANCVPNRPEHYLKPAGLRKFYAAWQSDPPKTPEYRSKEFSDRTAWKLRGKLNIPRERFIHYVGFDHTLRGEEAPESGGPWFGWAGWDAVERAEALAFLIEQANRAGWEMRWRQCGLRAALRDLLPELAELPSSERAEFEAIAEMCGLRLGTRCYCQAYVDGVGKGEPGVSGVGQDVLGLRWLETSERMTPKGTRSSDRDATQMELGLDAQG